MLEVAICRGVHGHGSYTEAMARTQDAQRDFAAIGDNDFFELLHSSRQAI
jgi:hypothetical protein